MGLSPDNKSANWVRSSLGSIAQTALIVATDTKPAENQQTNDKVQVKDAPVVGEAARSEAVQSFKPLVKDENAPPNPVTDGAMGMNPPPSDKTMVEYFDHGKSDGKNDAGDKSLDKPIASKSEGALEDYKKTMMRAGMSEDDATKLSRDTLTRLEKTKKGSDGALEGTPEQQMARMNKAMSDILDGCPDGKLANGQDDPLSPRDRENLVKDLAARQADPEKYVNQGKHMTCVLESNQKQRLEGGDPAKVAEQIASVVNTGSAEITQKDGKTRIVNVDSRSFAPDQESGQDFNLKTADNGQRGMAGHVYDALAGQTVADLRAEREGKPTSANGIGEASYVYMAAHADQLGGKPGQTNTNEALLAKKSDGSYKVLQDSPGVNNVWEMAHLSKAMGGETGAVFAHAGTVRDGVPPKGMGFPPDMRVTSFSSSEDLAKKLGDFQQKNGQSAQILVNAPFLPGGGENGHGLHAMNVKLDGNGKFDLDNNWGKKSDIGSVSGAVIDKATDPEKWNAKTAEGKAEPKPTDRTEIRPGSGRNPNESQADYQARLLEDQKKEKEKEEDPTKDLLKKNEKDAQAAEERYQTELQIWNAEKARAEAAKPGDIFVKPPPRRPQ